MPRSASQASEDTRRTPRQPRARATVDAILMAAAHILKTGGPERVSTNRIARLAGVSIGSLYQYFPNKEAVIAALRERHDDWYDDCVREEIDRAEDAPLRPAVRRAVERMVAMHVSDPELHNALSCGERALAPESEAEFRLRMREYLEAHADELRPMDAELVSAIATRALEAVIHGTSLDEPERLRHPRFAEEVTELFVRYVER